MSAKPYKITVQKKDVYCQHLREGMRRGEAARAIGTCRQSMCAHMRADPAFARAVAESEMDANDGVVSAMYKQALQGNMTAIQVWLYNRCPEEWADKRTTNHTGSVVTRFEDATPEEKKRRLERVLRLAGVTITRNASTGNNGRNGAGSNGHAH